GQQFLAAWAEVSAGADPRPVKVLAARIASDGSVIDLHPIPITDSASGGAAIGWNGTQFVVAWLDLRYAVRAARIMPDGHVLDPDGIQVTPDGAGLAMSCIANCLFSWADDTNVRSSVLRPDGTVGPGPSFALDHGGAVRSQAGSGEHLLAWFATA